MLGYLLALVVGLSLGLLGGGGSILTVPIFVYLLKVPALLATTYSLFVVGTSSLVGSWIYFKKRQIDLTIGLLFLLPSLLGVWISRAWILPALPAHLGTFAGIALSKDRLILLVFSLLMLTASRSMLTKRANSIPRTAGQGGEEKGFIAFLGLLAGALMGFVGAGGGFLIIPILVALGKLDMKVAIGTSLSIITLSSLFGFAGDTVRGVPIDWKMLGAFSSLSLIGVFIGVRLSDRVSSHALKKAFGVMVIFVAVAMLVKELGA